MACKLTCGCFVMIDNAVSKRPTRIVFCPLHLAAKDLFDAAQVALRQANRDSTGAINTEAIDRLQNAISTAEGKQ